MVADLVYKWFGENAMKILYVTTVGTTMEFFEDEFKHLIEQGHTVELACSSSWDYKNSIAKLGLKRYDVPFSRSPISLSNIKAYHQLKKIILNNKYDIVHCHTPNAAAITRLVCRRLRKNGIKVVYTAHGFHFYKGAPLINWLVFYPIEWICSHWTDVLLTMNSEDYTLAKNKLKAKNVDYVPGVGIDLGKFGNKAINIDDKKTKLGLDKDSIVLLSIGELNENKNHETVIKALEGLNVVYMIAGKGDKEQRLLDIAKEVGIEKNFKLLGYRNDIPELLEIADAFVFPSYREGLSVSLMETMASSKPAIVSRIRGNIDLIDENGGALFNPCSVEECRRAILSVTKADRKRMGQYNKEKVKKFSIEAVLQKIDEVYGG